MRHTLLALSTAAAVAFGSIVLGSGRAHAAVAAPGLGDASRSVNPIETTGCWRRGWHGWGWYPWCGFYGPGPGPYWGGPYWGPRWGWGRGWGWHRGWGWRR